MALIHFTHPICNFYWIKKYEIWLRFSIPVAFSRPDYEQQKHNVKSKTFNQRFIRSSQICYSSGSRVKGSSENGPSQITVYQSCLFHSKLKTYLCQ